MKTVTYSVQRPRREKTTKVVERFAEIPSWQQGRSTCSLCKFPIEDETMVVVKPRMEIGVLLLHTGCWVRCATDVKEGVDNE